MCIYYSISAGAWKALHSQLKDHGAMWTPADMSSSFQPMPLYGLYIWKLEDMSLDYEGAHQCPRRLLKLQVCLPRWQMNDAAVWADSCTATQVLKSDSWCWEKNHCLLSQDGGNWWERGQDLKHFICSTLNTSVTCSKGGFSLKVVNAVDGGYTHVMAATLCIWAQQNTVTLIWIGLLSSLVDQDWQ